MEAGETEVETALRELWEETGLAAELQEEKRAVIEYPISAVSRKQVIFFPGKVSSDPVPRPGEIEGFRWVKAEQLKDYLFPDTVEACASLLK
jgi:8-oxo-dGTP pyrophosphatase MutT (NUDIX family)